MRRYWWLKVWSHMGRGHSGLQMLVVGRVRVVVWRGLCWYNVVLTASDTRHCSTTWWGICLSVFHSMFWVELSIAYPTFAATNAMRINPSVSSSTSEKCFKCGIMENSAERSCCAPGSTWFKKCGNTGDPNFGHTWSEGVQVCKYFANSILVASRLQVMLRQIGAVNHRVNITPQRNTAQQRIDMYTFASVPLASTADPKDRIGLTKVVVCTCALPMISHLKTLFHSIRIY